MAAFTTPGTSADKTDFEIYKIFQAPVNSSLLYNNQDRICNVVYRAFTVGELGKLYGSWNPAAAPSSFGPISFQYEKQSNNISFHFWSSSALLGVGYSINNPGYGSGSAEQVAIAGLTTARGVLNSTLLAAMHLGNALFYRPQVQSSTFVASSQWPTFSGYEYKVKLVRGSVGVTALFGFVFTSLVQMGIAGRLLEKAANLDPNDPKKAESVAVSALLLLAGVTGAGANFMKGLNSIGGLSRVTQTVAGQLYQKATQLATTTALAQSEAVVSELLRGTLPTILGQSVKDALVIEVSSAINRVISSGSCGIEGALEDAIRIALARKFPVGVVVSDLDVIEGLTQSLSSLVRKTIRAPGLGGVVEVTKLELAAVLSGIKGVEQLTASQFDCVVTQVATQATHNVSSAGGRLGAKLSPVQSIDELTEAAFARFGAGAFGRSPVSTVSKFSANANKAMGIAGTVLGLVNGVVGISTLAPILARKNLTEEQRGVLIAELSVQVAGGVGQAASNLALAINLAKGFTSGAAIVGPALGAAAAGLLVVLTPLQIYGLVKQSEYADKLADLGREISAYGYSGDSLLANLYSDKTAAEGGILAATTALAVIGSAVTVASTASVVGVPLAVVVSIATAIAGGILQGISQPMIEKIATDYAKKIQAQGGPLTYFEKSLNANHAQFIGASATIEYLKLVQADYGVDSVVAVSGVALSSTARELAVITANAANAHANGVYIDRFVDGKIKADRTIKDSLHNPRQSGSRMINLV
jgi:N-terminal domain in RTX protein